MKGIIIREVVIVKITPVGLFCSLSEKVNSARKLKFHTED